MRTLAVILLCVPLVLALEQVYLVQTSDLSRWKGGGFGMYTDPHPQTNRFVWLRGPSDEGVRAMRLYPLDPRLLQPFFGDDTLKPLMNRVRDAAKRSQCFPSLPRLEPLDAAVHRLIEAATNDSVLIALFPDSSLEVVVVEVALSKGYQTVFARTVSERRLCDH